MAGKDEERDALIDRMLGARTVGDAEAANASADAWLKDPGDLRIIAAQERLDEKGARMRDPERNAGQTTLAVYICAFSGAALVVFALTGRLYAAGLAGLLVVFGFPWDGVGEAIVEWRRGPGLSGRENGER